MSCRHLTIWQGINRALSLWEVGPANDKETNMLPISLPLSNIVQWLWHDICVKQDDSRDSVAIVESDPGAYLAPGYLQLSWSCNTVGIYQEYPMLWCHNSRPRDGCWVMCPIQNLHYRKTSSISRTKSQTLNVDCILLQLSSLNPLKPGVKLRMKM